MDLLDPAIELRFLSCRQILYQLNYQGSPYDTVEVIIQHNAGDAAEKDTPHPKAKEKPQHDGKRGKNTFRIKPHTCQRCSEGSNKTCTHQNPEIPKRLSQNCVGMPPVEVRVSCGLPQGQGLWVPQTWI